MENIHNLLLNKAERSTRVFVWVRPGKKQKNPLTEALNFYDQTKAKLQKITKFTTI